MKSELPTPDDADELLRRERSGSVRRQLSAVCGELTKLCSNSYTYGLRSLVNEFKIADSRHVMTSLDTSDRLASSYTGVLKLLDEHDVKLHKVEDWEVVLSPIFDLLTQISRFVIQPLIESARRQEEPVPAGSFDRYADFRRRWNRLVERLDDLAKAVGFKRDLSSIWFAPELGVASRT